MSLLLFSFFGCVSPRRGPESTKVSSLVSNLGLEASDISVLFPPAGVAIEDPSKEKYRLAAAVLGVTQTSTYEIEESLAEERLAHLTKRGFWPRLIGSEGGKVFLPESELQSLLRHFQSKAEQTTGQRKGRLEGPLVLKAYKSLIEAPPKSAISPGVGAPDGFETISFDMSSPERWRIVSFRLDPCPYGHVMQNKGIKLQPEVVEARKTCRPEIRVVAQPILGLDAAESVAGALLPRSSIVTKSKRVDKRIERWAFPHIPLNPQHLGWYFADYAIHLFYRISKKQMNDTARALLSLKRRYLHTCGRNLRSLGIHPCIRAAYLGAAPFETIMEQFHWMKRYPYASSSMKIKSESSELLKVATRYGKDWGKLDYAKAVSEIFASPLSVPHKAAVFVSSSNIDPWIFRLFRREKDGQWSSKIITALDSSPFETTDTYGVREDLSTRGVQVIPRGAKVSLTQKKRGSEKDREFERRLKKGRLVPSEAAKRDSLDVFLRTAEATKHQTNEEYLKLHKILPDIQQKGLRRIKITKNRNVDLSQMLARVNNPRLNDEFSVSCGSCHLASIESNLMGTFWRFYPHFKAALDKSLNPMGKVLPRFGVQNFREFIDSVQGESESEDLILMKNHRYLSESSSFTPPASDFQQVFSSSSRTVTDRVFVFNQFSLYRDTPVISHRVAHETDMALQHLRKNVFQESAGNETMTCNRPVLRACMMSPPLRGGSFWLGVEFLEENCWHPEAQICAVRE